MFNKKIILRIKKILPPKIFKYLLFIKHFPLKIMGNFLEIKYHFFNNYSKKYGLTINKRKIPIILSTTTFPARINKAHLSIETILNQNVKPDKIYLWLAEEEFPLGEKSLPKNITKLKKRGLEIRFTKINLRSNNKLFHSLKENKEAIIITFDDDCFYPKDYIEKLYQCYKKYPLEIIGYDAMEIKTDVYGNPLPYNEWFEYSPEKISGKEVLLLSVNGILYPPRLLPKETLNKKKLVKYSLFNDDLWFKSMALLNNIPHRRVYKRNKRFISIPETQKFGLNKINVLENRNDRIIKDLFREYNLYKFFKKNEK